MRKCLECETELANSDAIIFHTCEAYPAMPKSSWLDILINNKEEGEGK
jgi:hypothetical protein